MRNERVKAGLDAKRERVKKGLETWNVGRKKGQTYKVDDEVRAAVKAMKDANRPITEIARVLQLSRPTIYSVLNAL